MAKLVIMSGPTSSGKTTKTKDLMSDGYIHVHTLEDACKWLRQGMNCVLDPEGFNEHTISIYKTYAE